MGNESWGMFLQQLAAVVTAVLWVLVAKKSRNVKQAVSPPSRTIDEGNSTDIFSKVWSQVSRFLKFIDQDTYTQSLLSEVNKVDLYQLLTQDGDCATVDDICC